MGREKLKMDLISNEKSRSKTFKTRKKGLIKKAQEFSTLCGVKMCMIIYGPQAGDDAPPEIWPADPSQVLLVIDEFTDRKSHGTKSFQARDYLALELRKVGNEIAKLRKANTAARFSRGWDDDRFKNLSLSQIKALIAKLDSTVELAKRRMTMLKSKNQVLAPYVHTGLNLGFDVITSKNFNFSNHDQVSGSNLINSLDHNEELILSHMHLQPPQWAPFDPIPATNPVMMLPMVNGLDFTSNTNYWPYPLAPSCDPTSSFGSTAFTELTPVMASAGYYYGPSVEPLTVGRQPSEMLGITSQLQLSQFSEYCLDLNEYEPKNKRQRFL